MSQDGNSSTNLLVYDFLKRSVGDKVANLFRKNAKLQETELPKGSPSIQDMVVHYHKTTTPQKRKIADGDTPRAAKKAKKEESSSEESSDEEEEKENVKINGKANGKANGHVNGKANGHVNG